MPPQYNPYNIATFLFDCHVFIICIVYYRILLRGIYVLHIFRCVLSNSDFGIKSIKKTYWFVNLLIDVVE